MNAEGGLGRMGSLTVRHEGHGRSVSVRLVRAESASCKIMLDIAGAKGRAEA